MAYSFVLPIMSMFLVEHLGAQPALIGIFTVATAIMSLLVNRTVGNLIDRGSSAKKLFLIANGCLILAGVAFASLQYFWQAVLIGMTLFASGNSCIPILLVLIRRHADQSNISSTKLNAQMRSSVSLMWVLGPALSFSCIEHFGFSATYLTAASLALIALLMSAQLLPDYSTTQLGKSQESTTKAAPPLRFWLLGMVILLGNFSNGLYLVSMPLYVKLELGLTESAVGVLMGITAALEIPILLLAPKLSDWFGRQRLFSFAYLAGCGFYLSLQLADSYHLLVLVQLLNGLFFGIFAGLSISILQDELPQRIGYASSFFTNAMRIGSMLGSTTAGLLAQLNGYQFSLLGALAGATVAVLILIIVHFRFPPPLLMKP